MMKKLILAVCMFCAVGAQAQKVELGIAGGPKLRTGGYIGSAAAYVKLWKLQVGAVYEAGKVEYNSVFLPRHEYNIKSPGVNVNYIIPIKRGYVYPGIAARTTWGRNDINHNLRGTELGVHAGVTFKIVKSLYANTELGLRAQTVRLDMYKMRFDDEINTPREVLPLFMRETDFNIPMMVGLRWAF